MTQVKIFFSFLKIFIFTKVIPKFIKLNFKKIWEVGLQGLDDLIWNDPFCALESNSLPLDQDTT